MIVTGALGSFEEKRFFMNRVDLVASMAELSGMKKADIDKFLSAFIETVTSELVKKEEVRLVGFGTFTVSHRNASEGRNMRTGDVIKIPARNVPKFKPGKLLKDAVANIK